MTVINVTGLRSFEVADDGGTVSLHVADRNSAAMASTFPLAEERESGTGDGVSFVVLERRRASPPFSAALDGAMIT